MLSLIVFLVALIATSLCTSASLPAADEIPQQLPQVAATTAPVILQPAAEEGFTSLLPAHELDGWTVHDGRAQAWQAADGMISCVGLGGGWLRTDKTYSDFVLKLEYRLQLGGNTGVAVRAPDIGNPTAAGLEVQLLDDTAEKYVDLRPDQYTGSLYYQAAPQQKAKLNPPGEWNQCEVHCIGDSLTVKINGEVVNQVQLAPEKVPDAAADATPVASFALSERPPIGHIALQSHSTRVDFRNLQLKDLTVRTNSGLQFVELASGQGEEVGQQATVTVHYVGQLPDGKRFSNTRDYGPPVTVPLTAVIPGWREGIGGMKVGGKRRLIVPPTLGYGSAGVENLIPPDTTLVFEVELCGFQR